VALFRRGGLPDGVPAPEGERVLAWAVGPQGIFIATDIAFHVPGTLTPQRTVWHLIDRASWRDPYLDVALHATVGGPLATWKVELTEPGKLPQVVRERVTSSVITSLDVDLAGGKARIAARRTENDAVRWSVTPLEGADLSDPDSRAQASALITELASSLGL
jgi:hypothetical protein